MSAAKAGTGRRLVFGFAFAALGLAALPPSPAAAQCTLAGGISQFEPNPPGAARPWSLSVFLSIGGFFPFQVGASTRLLVTENFGYQVVDITNRANPVALGFEDYRDGGTGPVPCNGDCHGTMGPMGVSKDGQRAIFGLNALQSSPYHTVVAQLTNGWQYALAGDMRPVNPGGVLVQQMGTTYVAYTFADDGVRVADVTSLPGLGVDNIAWSLAGALPANGYQAYLSGYWLTYTDGPNVYLVNASSPLPASRLTAQALTAASFGRSTDMLASYSAIQDPSDASAVYVLGEFRSGSSHGGWAVVRVRSGQVTVVGTFRPPAGETNTYSNAFGTDVAGNVFAAMWTRTPAGAFRLYTALAGSFGAGTGSFDVTTPGFNAGRPTLVAGSSAGQIFAYVPAGSSGWVVPMSCVSPHAPATSTFAVSANGTALTDGDHVFVGDLLAITPTVSPSPAIQPLTGFGWHFDFDFHAGAAVEDGGLAASPRILNADNNVFGNPVNPPASISLVGPCDPKAGGDPIGGGGCWNSVKTNNAAGGPDYSGAELPGSFKPLTIALEAKNQYGAGVPALFTVNWTIPAARIASTQVLSGQSLVSASDGHPTAAGFKWYFGDSPSTLSLAAGCPGAACVPTLDTRGTHYYWLTASYANGYRTADYSSAAMGTYTVTDFSPSFTVNGSTTSASTFVSQGVTVSNASVRGSGITGAYSYNLCQIVSPATTCVAGAYTALVGMVDPPPSGSPATTATFTAPSLKGSYLLRIQVNYTGGTTVWPDPAGVAGFPVTVAEIVPTIRVYTNGQDPCPPGPGGSGCSGTYSGYAGDTFTAYSYLNNQRDSSPPAGISWDFPSGSPASAPGQGATFSYAVAGTYTISLHGYGTDPVTATVVVFPRLQQIWFHDSCGFGCSDKGSLSTTTGTLLNAWAYSNGAPDTLTPNITWSAPGATPASGSGRTFTLRYDNPGTYTLTLNGSGSPVTATVTVTGAPISPLVIGSVTATPSSVAPNTNVAFACGASGGVPPYTYSWTFSDGGTANGASASRTYASPATYTATCSATDGLANASAPTSVIVSLPGPYFLFVLSPCRILDTRYPTGPLGGPAIQPAGSADRSFPVASACGIPADAKALSVNVTATNTTASGVISIYRGDGQPTGTTTLPLLPGRTRSNNAMLQLALDGSGTIRVQNTSTGTTDLIIDVNGFFR